MSLGLSDERKQKHKQKKKDENKIKNPNPNPNKEERKESNREKGFFVCLASFNINSFQGQTCTED